MPSSGAAENRITFFTANADAKLLLWKHDYTANLLERVPPVD
jgi:hypothetical protein